MDALVVTVPATEAELAADMLWALGVLAIEERTLTNQPNTELNAMVELWTSLGDDAEQVQSAARGFPATWRWRLVAVDEDVANTWRAYAEPTWVDDDLVIVPAWKSIDAGEAISIAIEPGSSFGLGDHSTTVLSLRAIRAVLVPGATVLDVGCGSGVLAIAACRLGAVRAVGIDISAAAVQATRDNAQLNGVEAMIEASTTPLGELADAIDGPFDVVVANILAPELVALATDLQRVVADDGVLVISGILAGRYDHVVEALAPLRVVEVIERQGWVAVTLRRADVSSRSNAGR